MSHTHTHTHTHVGIPAFLPSFASCCWSRVHEHTRNSLTWSDRSCRWSAGVSDRGRGAYGCDTPGGSSESVNGEDGPGLAQSHRAGSSTPSHHSSSVALSAFNAQLGQGSACRPRGDQDQERQRGPMGSADFSHHTSSSNSPVNCKDASDCHLRSASLSSDDVRGLSQSQQTLSRSATLPYDDTPQRAQPQRGGGIRSRARPSSPGSEMVTLEQFLQESTLKSSPPQRVGSREDFMPEYFSRSPASPGPGGRDQATPTSYVAPTVHASNTQRPGQSVTPSSQASGRRPVTLSRTFSLASADLLRSDGPEGFHGNRSDGVVRRPGANGRERPLSARMASDRHGGLLNSPVHHSSSLTLQTDGCVERGRKEGLPSSSSVAMVSPVRAAPAAPLDPASEHGEERAGDKASERVRCDSAEGPKSTPASPDPNNDPQTVWYEYGCV